jgi:hypothetical protein
MLHGTSMSSGSTSSAFGISGQLTTRHRRIGVQSMVNRMNRLLGCSLATGLQGKNEEVSKTTHLVLSAVLDTFSRLPSGAMVNRSVRLSMYGERQVGCRANGMSIEKSALREFNSRALDLSHKGSDCLMSAP